MCSNIIKRKNTITCLNFGVAERLLISDSQTQHRVYRKLQLACTLNFAEFTREMLYNDLRDALFSNTYVISKKVAGDFLKPCTFDPNYKDLIFV